MCEHAVIIAGGGPTGLMLGAELKLAGVDVAIIEKRAQKDRVQPGALGLHARTIEVFDQRGIADRLLAEGKPMQVLGFSGVRFDISAFPSRHPYGLALIQKHSERIILNWADEVGVPIIRGVEIIGFTEDASGIAVALRDGRQLRAQYLVGCDGGRSFIRKAAGIAFPGSDPTVSHLLAEARMTSEPECGLRSDAIGTHALSKTEDGKIGILVTERSIEVADPTLDHLREGLIAHYGSDYGIHSPAFITRFTDMTRQAETYRKGRVLLAGDAAHIHYPAGGFGMNLGIQDAVNLGWKLALVVNGAAPHSLLDTYHAERHPVAARMLRYTMATVALSRSDDRTQALSAIVSEIVGMGEPQLVTAGRMSGLDIRYDLGEGHPLLGRRMPDLDLPTAEGQERLYMHLREARPVLLTLGCPGSVDAGLWSDYVRTVHANYDGHEWNLPVTGAVSAPSAVLIRPDGYVAWVGQGTHAGLVEALTAWFGMR
ncbi:Rifampicin monooxygenase [Hyphomicrobium sp. 1Nfss2.1]|uniref:FAD-dependent monooxygenase n=1 Tax=Hyphomicrobium sp. 1Nfss2.1 TaxID=3413936 RepID=UPI003C7EC59D